MILAGEYWWTNARLAYFSTPERSLAPDIRARSSPSREHSNLGENCEPVLARFRHASRTRRVLGSRARGAMDASETSNLPWVIEQSRLAKQTHLPATLLINDLEASALGHRHTPLPATWFP